jgi:hypothetical protein
VAEEAIPDAVRAFPGRGNQKMMIGKSTPTLTPY